MRVLFVDDDLKLLQGVRRVFLNEPGIEALFAPSGQEGLEILGKEPVDIVVADMRMPCMDGASFLAEVRLRNPEAVRIVLSGHSDPTILLRSVRPAHQFLSKPCDFAELKDTLCRLYNLRALVANPSAARIISQVDALPVLRESLDALSRDLSEADCDLSRVAETVANDAGLAATLLKTVNSSFFAPPCRLESIHQAVTYLGVDILRSLIRDEGLFNVVGPAWRPGFSLRGLRDHSRNAAAAAKAMAESGPLGVSADLCFKCGLLHDAGKLILLDRFADEYAAVIVLCKAENISVIEAERRLLDVTHAELGAYLLGLWGFPELLVRAVSGHHEPGRLGKEDNDLAIIAHAANVFEHELVVVNSDYATPTLDREYLRKAGIGEPEIARWRDACTASLSIPKNLG